MNFSHPALSFLQEVRPSCEEQLLLIQARIENIRNGKHDTSEHPHRCLKTTQRKKLCSQLKEFSAVTGSDDALLEECELLSRDRDEQVNRLAVRDSLALNKSKGPVPRQVRCPCHVLDATVLNRWRGV
jgi:hypothetical protein